MLIFLLTYFLNLKMENICSSETPVDFHWTKSTWSYIPGGRTPHIHRCEDLKYSIKMFVSLSGIFFLIRNYCSESDEVWQQRAALAFIGRF
jgi:hypothetical protein